MWSTIYILIVSVRPITHVRYLLYLLVTLLYILLLLSPGPELPAQQVFIGPAPLRYVPASFEACRDYGPAKDFANITSSEWMGTNWAEHPYGCIVAPAFPPKFKGDLPTDQRVFFNHPQFSNVPCASSMVPCLYTLN